MKLRLLFHLLPVFGLFVSAPVRAENHLSIVVSVPEQRLYVFNTDGEELTHYSVSTSKFGVGDHRGSYNTPLGRLEVASKYGSGALAGTVFKALARTGEICPVNARGRDPIVSRVLWLRGLEKQNSDAYGRHIYIHGTPDELHIGKIASFGCIRMRSRDIIALYETVDVGTSVEIVNRKVGGGMFSKAKWEPMPAIAAAPPKPKVVEPAASVAANTKGTKGAKAAASVSADPAKETASATPAKSAALSLSEPLIGAPDTPAPKAGSKKKSVPTGARKNRS